MRKKTSVILVGMVILGMSLGSAGNVSSVYQQDRAPLLAFSRLDYRSLSSVGNGLAREVILEHLNEDWNCEVPVALPPEGGGDWVLFATAHLYDPADGSVRCIAEGDGVQWSNTGRYLAVTTGNQEGRNDHPRVGPIRHFTVWDTVTHTAHGHDYQFGDRFYWSPDDDYLVVTGGIQGTMGGSNAWVDIFPGDGSGDFDPPSRLGYAGFIGTHGGTFFSWIHRRQPGAVIYQTR